MLIGPSTGWPGLLWGVIARSTYINASRPPKIRASLRACAVFSRVAVCRKGTHANVPAVATNTT